MKKTKKTYTPDFKSRLAIEAFKERYSVSDIASSYLVHESLIRAWRQRFCSSIAAFFSSNQGDKAESAEIDQIEQRINDLRTEQEWMSGVAAKLLDLHARREIIDPEDDGLSILRQSRLLGLHRSGVYYQRHKEAREHLAMAHEHAADAERQLQEAMRSFTDSEEDGEEE